MPLTPVQIRTWQTSGNGMSLQWQCHGNPMAMRGPWDDHGNPMALPSYASTITALLYLQWNHMATPELVGYTLKCSDLGSRGQRQGHGHG